MAKSKKRGGLHNRAIRLSTMKKNPPSGGDGMKSGGTAKIGRTIEVKAHPSHPGLDFVAARGSKHGRSPSNKQLTGPVERRARRKEKKGK